MESPSCLFGLGSMLGCPDPVFHSAPAWTGITSLREVSKPGHLHHADSSRSRRGSPSKNLEKSLKNSYRPYEPAGKALLHLRPLRPGRRPAPPAARREPVSLALKAPKAPKGVDTLLFLVCNSRTLKPSSVSLILMTRKKPALRKTLSATIGSQAGRAILWRSAHRKVRDLRRSSPAHSRSKLSSALHCPPESWRRLFPH
jgi:hypothetical protein